MIHIATVHWMTDRWIDVQLRYLERHVSRPYRVYACLTGIGREQAARFDFAATTEESKHPKKLNFLAKRIAEQAGDDDLLLFMDGDSFPIADLREPLEEMLAQRPLAAIRRDENLMDPQPHPSFCATTVGFWKEIGGDWRRGPPWQNAAGDSIGDVGGRVLVALEERGIEWAPLVRTNEIDLHPLYFGVYGNLVYHHGAGFRAPLSRRDHPRPSGNEGRAGPVQGRGARGLWDRGLRWLRRRRNQRLSERVYQRISASESFPWELFFRSEGGAPLPPRIGDVSALPPRVG
jgi:hypothetical protein